MGREGSEKCPRRGLDLNTRSPFAVGPRECPMKNYIRWASPRMSCPGVPRGCGVVKKVRRIRCPIVHKGGI